MDAWGWATGLESILKADTTTPTAPSTLKKRAPQGQGMPNGFLKLLEEKSTAQQLLDWTDSVARSGVPSWKRSPSARHRYLKTKRPSDISNHRACLTIGHRKHRTSRDIFDSSHQFYIGKMNFDEQVARIDVIAKENLTGQSAVQTFDDAQVENLSEQELDGLPFGAIQLDANGKILKYNDYESKLAGIAKVQAIGKQFFTEVAPCTNVKEFHGRFLAGVAEKVLHAKFRYHFSFRKNPRDVSVTLFYSDITDSIWVFIRPV
jgi:photoactive yellow protein